MAISNKIKGFLNKMNSTAFKASLGTVIQTAENAIAANASAIGGKSIVSCSQETTVGGTAAEAFTIAGVLATDQAFIQLVDDGTNNVSVASVACTENTVTVTFSANPGNDAIINVLVIR